jgi:hypothetical protein
MSSTALHHLEHLATTIGPRGSATPKEKEGHAYVQQVLTELGCNPRTETFPAAVSVYTPFMVALGVVLLAELIFYTLSLGPNANVGALAALILSGTATACAVLELLRRDNPLRWFLPVEPSQNVVGVTPAANGEPKRRVAVLAHVDTHRTPLFWRTPTTYLVYRGIMIASLISLAVLNVIFLVSVFVPGLNLHPISLIPAAVVLVAFAMVTQAHFTPFTAGANDNASGVGVLLALAEKLKSEPLANTEVWWVATGCEEVGAYGSDDFIRQHGEQFREGAVISVDNVAGRGTHLAYIQSEGILKPVSFPAAMLTLAEQIAKEQPTLGARPLATLSAYTDATPALEQNIPALSFISVTESGWLPNWHNPNDVFAEVDAEAVDRAEQFIWAVLQRLDQA